MATKNIVPNSDGEGKLGTSSKSWAEGHIDSITGTIATAAQGNITSLGTLTSLNISGGFTASSASTITVNDNTANLTLTCTDADATVGPMLFFKRDSASAATNDQIGTIFFTGRDAANSEDITYATIETHINESTDGQEGGKMTFKIASHDAESVAGLTLTDGDAEDEVDVTIASGTSSVTTISGNLKIPNDGTIGSAGTAGAITIDSNGIVGIGSTGIYAGTNAILNLQGSGIALKNDRNGSNNNWSYIQNDGTGSEATLLFSTGNAVPALKLSHSGLLTMSPGASSNPRIEFAGASVSGSHYIQLDRGSGASTSSFEVYLNGATKFEVKADGNVEIADGSLVIANAGDGINFEAETPSESGAGSASSSVLDDYEEGTWVPTIIGASGNVATSNSTFTRGDYTKIGRLVHCSGQIVLTSLGSASGAIQMGGFPFINQNVQGAQSGGIVGTATNLNISAGHNVTFNMLMNSQNAAMRIYDDAAGITSMTASEFSADGEITFSVTYMTNT